MSKWKEYQFKNLGTTYGGLTNKNKDDFGFGKPYIPYLNIFENTFIDSKFVEYVSIKRAENQNKTKYGDLFFTTSSETPNEVGMTSILLNNFDELYLNSFCFGFRLHNFETLLPKFAGYIFRSSFVRRRISILAQGSTRYNLSKSIFFEKLFLNLPPLPHQRKIARILTTIDNVIEKTEEAIAKYKAIKQGMMHDLFTRGIDPETGKLRPTKEEAPHLYKKTELGWIPKEWEVERLEDVCALSVSNVDKKSRDFEEKVFLCNYMDVYENNCITNQIIFMEATAPLSQISSFELEIGDVLITKDSEVPEDIAVPSVVKEIKKNLLCGYHLAILRPNTEIFIGEYLYFQLNLEFINKHFYQHANGSTRYGLTKDSIYKAKIIRSKKDEQKQVIGRLSVLDNKIQTEQKQLSKLQKLKQGLMQDLLTGKKEVEPDKEDYDE